MQRYLRTVLYGAIYILAAILQMAPAVSATEVKTSDVLQKISFKGDFRLRYEAFQYKLQNKADREGFRFRLRVGSDFSLPQNLTVKLRLASGTGENTGTNQTFDGNSKQKQVWIDQVYLKWDALADNRLFLQGGRMENAMWRPTSADLLWDPDYNPEGAAEGGSILLGGINLFYNAQQSVIDEDYADGATSTNTVNSAANADQYLWSEQIGAEFKLPAESRLKLAVAYHDWKNLRNSSIGDAKGNEGNRETSGIRNNQFGVLEMTGELKGWVGNRPLSLLGTMIENTRVGNRNELGAPQEKKNNGYQTGLIFGKADEPRTFEVAYLYKWLEADATIDEISDSDFGQGGTNRYGHIGWVSYAPVKGVTFTGKYFVTKNIDTALTGANGDINRLQVDCLVKF